MENSNGEKSLPCQITISSSQQDTQPEKERLWSSHYGDSLNHILNKTQLPFWFHYLAHPLQHTKENYNNKSKTLLWNVHGNCSQASTKNPPPLKGVKRIYWSITANLKHTWHQFKFTTTKRSYQCTLTLWSKDRRLVDTESPWANNS